MMQSQQKQNNENQLDEKGLITAGVTATQQISR
jgi:hypothetical protein